MCNQKVGELEHILACTKHWELESASAMTVVWICFFFVFWILY